MEKILLFWLALGLNSKPLKVKVIESCPHDRKQYPIIIGINVDVFKLFYGFVP